MGYKTQRANVPPQVAAQQRSAKHITRAWVESGFDEALFLKILKEGDAAMWWTEPEGEDTVVRACRVWYDEASNAYAVSTPYNQSFVLWWKSEVPKEHRSWNAEQKLWFVSPQLKDKVLKELKKVFGDVHVTEKVEATSIPTILDENEFTIFCQLVGKEILKEAYRKASLVLHPDKGGNATKMAELNRAWATVQKGIK